MSFTLKECAVPSWYSNILFFMDTISINPNVPKGWHELDDKQLRYVYSHIAKEFSADEIKTLALLHFSGCKVIARHDKNSFLLKHGKNRFQTSGTLIAEVIPSLGWLDAIPASPVRLKKLRNHASVDAEFQGVPFEKYVRFLADSQSAHQYALKKHQEKLRFLPGCHHGAPYAHVLHRFCRVYGKS